LPGFYVRLQPQFCAKIFITVSYTIKAILLILLPVILIESAYSQTGKISGRILNAYSKEGLPGASVSIVKLSIQKAADSKGDFEIPGIPAGEYDITFENVGYDTIVQHISLKANQNLKLYAALDQKINTLDSVTIFSRFNKEEEAGARQREKNAANVTNVISAQAMVRSPDINAANVLQRMSGVTIQRSSGGDEAYSVIRGMEPRYNNTLVNGIKIASPDEKARFVQLDIIPSDILSSIEISKSLLPDMEADAIGGTVNMVVKDAPDNASFKATASVGYSQLFWDEKYIGFDKSQIQPLSPIQRNPRGYVTQPGDFSRSNLDFQYQQAPPTGTLGFTYTHRFFKNKLGIIIADNAQNQYYGNISSLYSVSPVNEAVSNDLHAIDVSNYNGYTQQFNNGLVAHVDYVFNKNNRISINNVYIYSYLAQTRFSQDTTLEGTGRTGPGTGQVFANYRSLTQHEHIENLKISGQHLLSENLILDWAGVLSEAGKRAPDRAEITTDFLINSNLTRTGTYFDGISRIWQKNDDKDYTGIINLTWRTKLKPNELEIKAGGLYRSKSRFNSQDMYQLNPPTTNGNGGSTGGKPAWTNIYDAQWSVFNAQGSNAYDPNSYTAGEKVAAGYVMAKFHQKNFDLGGGARVENTQQNFNINTQSLTALTSANIVYTDVLPSIYLKYRLSLKENLRLSYFKSISRPNYYELVPYTIRGVDFNEVGNPYLKHAVADNYDIRYELYPKEDEQIFAGVFYKRIQNPIELALQGVSGGQIEYTPSNFGTAHTYGAELAFTKYWGNFGITGNYTYTHSAITSPKILYYKANHDPNLPQIDSLHVNETRPLQGQADHILNVSLLYKNVRHGFFAQLAYGYQGKTLAEVAVYYQSDYYQTPMSTLAFSLEKDIHKHFTIFGKFNNLLNTPTTLKSQGTLVVATNIYRASYNLGIRYSH